MVHGYCTCSHILDCPAGSQAEVLQEVEVPAAATAVVAAAAVEAVPFLVLVLVWCSVRWHFLEAIVLAVLLAGCLRAGFLPRSVHRYLVGRSSRSSSAGPSSSCDLGSSSDFCSVLGPSVIGPMGLASSLP